ncbi:hypothetical protein LUW77_01515 [Streptomyces radiopugnans]|nr:hypothetical protein LUW77_01515 [Streptomyces radiopugnans]
MSPAQQPAVTRRHPPKALMKLVNPVIRARIERGRGGVAKRLLLLHFTGRRTGREFDVPAARQDVGGRLCVFTDSGWRVNFREGADIEVTLDGERTPMRAVLDEDPDSVAAQYAEKLAEIGHRKANRLGITVNVDRLPTVDEIRDAVVRHGLSVVHLTPRG